VTNDEGDAPGLRRLLSSLLMRRYVFVDLWTPLVPTCSLACHLPASCVMAMSLHLPSIEAGCYRCHASVLPFVFNRARSSPPTARPPVRLKVKPTIPSPVELAGAPPMQEEGQALSTRVCYWVSYHDTAKYACTMPHVEQLPELLPGY
jgi:hypothetical protein